MYPISLRFVLSPFYDFEFDNWKSFWHVQMLHITNPSEVIDGNWPSRFRILATPKQYVWKDRSLFFSRVSQTWGVFHEHLKSRVFCRKVITSISVEYILTFIIQFCQKCPRAAPSKYGGEPVVKSVFFALKLRLQGAIEWQFEN